MVVYEKIDGIDEWQFSIFKQPAEGLKQLDKKKKILKPIDPEPILY